MQHFVVTFLKRSKIVVEILASAVIYPVLPHLGRSIKTPNSNPVIPIGQNHYMYLILFITYVDALNYRWFIIKAF